MLDNTKALMAIDPGLGSTGYAIWCPTKAGTLELADVGLRSAPRRGDLPERAFVLAESLAELDRGWKANVVCEFPEFQGGAVRSMGWKTGDLQSLTFLVGVISATLHCRSFRLVKPSQWKGQLPKDIVIERLRARLGRKFCDDLCITKDAWDAVGIGMWAQGRF